MRDLELGTLLTSSSLGLGTGLYLELGTGLGLCSGVLSEI